MPTTTPCEATLYTQHIQQKNQTIHQVLDQTDYQHCIIAAGNRRFRFQDDLFYPFQCNPFFKEWVPLHRRPGSYLHLRRGQPPRLFLLCEDDLWHTPPQTLPPGFDAALDIVECPSSQQLLKQLSDSAAGAAFIGEDNTLAVPEADHNPDAVIKAISYYRRFKTPYEHHCVRQANRLAAPAHRAAYEAFMAGASELAIGAAYLSACGASESEMPYPMIVGLNHHAAVLHHFELDNQPPKSSRSLLLDAGVDYHGYASDITRSYARDPHSHFAQLIQSIDTLQQQLVAQGAIGKSPVELHRLFLEKLAGVLIEHQLITVSLEQALAKNLTELFCPHGLGHHLGCNVHDKGSDLANSAGDQLPASAYTKLRGTAAMVASQIYTVEPGLYFIPSRLNPNREGPLASCINWPVVDALIPFGGIRIEDNIILHQDGSLENLTREAFIEPL